MITNNIFSKSMRTLLAEGWGHRIDQAVTELIREVNVHKSTHCHVKLMYNFSRDEYRNMLNCNASVSHLPENFDYTLDMPSMAEMESIELAIHESRKHVEMSKKLADLCYGIALLGVAKAKDDFFSTNPFAYINFHIASHFGMEPISDFESIEFKMNEYVRENYCNIDNYGDIFNSIICKYVALLREGPGCDYLYDPGYVIAIWDDNCYDII